MIDLRLGDWRDVLANVECDALVTDPPYSSRTHSATTRLRNGDGSLRTTEIGYTPFTEKEVGDFCDSWAPRTRGWFCVLTSHDLGKAWERALEKHGRYVFAPIPCVLWGMGVRLAGDGPANWTVWMVVSRPRSKPWSVWGSLPGAYRGTPPSRGQDAPTGILGNKPLWLMNGIIRDYTRPGDLVCDPCAGYGTTLQSAIGLGRKAIGAEIDPDTHAKAMQRLEHGQMEFAL